MGVPGELAVHFGNGFTGGFARVEYAERVQADGQVLQCGQRMCPVAPADAAVVFAVGGVPGQVQFVLDAPVPAVERKQPVFVGFFRRKVGYAADGFRFLFRPLRPGAPDHEGLGGEGEVDPAGGDGRGDDPADNGFPAGLVNGAVRRGKKRAPRGAVRSVGAGRAGCL